jgi:Putative porin
MILRNLCLLTLSGICALTMCDASGADESALLDALVRKGVLTNKEAEEVQSEAAQSAQPLASKIIVGDWVKELKLSGDLRLRNQWDERNPQLPKAPNQTNYDGNIQRDRWRFRLRLNVDFKLAGDFFGGVQLSTSDNRNAATGNATYTGGYDNYNIYISRAFLGWNPMPALTFIAGKQANPFYTTDLFWSPDVNPTGLVERVDFHKMFDFAFGEPVAGDGKTPPPPPAPAAGNAFELSLIAGQFIFEDNNEDSNVAQFKNDAYQFETQLLTRLKLGKNLSITVAPAVFITNSAAVGVNSLSGGNFNLTSVPAAGALGSQNNAQPFPITDRDLFILLVPGDITYKIAGKPLSIYWDFAYNFQGNDRFKDLGNPYYGAAGPLSSGVTFNAAGTAITGFTHPWNPSASDNMAWLVGVRYGENKKAGDLMVSIDYRQIGISSVDPNINSDDFGLSNLNSAGFEGRIAYNLTDFLTLGVTGYYSEALTKNLSGGFATGTTFPIARDHRDKVIQVDLMMKF